MEISSIPHSSFCGVKSRAAPGKRALERQERGPKRREEGGGGERSDPGVSLLAEEVKAADSLSPQGGR